MAEQDTSFSGFLSEILKPGSSLHPIFTLCVDIAFSLLLVVLLTCAFVTQGNIHFIALTLIALALWASVKWFIAELRKLPPPEPESTNEEDKKNS
ncbi:hypothetical protein DL96DRAFT_1707013 [Flagelloscypha sp. PMI_526]|nr:hypothetical protein DL96DRAFT_1707013 [Flagelloscypha sp. PMI_526]